MGARTGKVAEIQQRLKKFVTHDVRKSPILGLYLVIGMMVLGYGIYFAAVMYKDLTGTDKEKVAAGPKVAQVKKAPTAEKEVPEAQDTPGQEIPIKKKGETKEVAEKVKAVSTEKPDLKQWKSVEFPDGSHISYPSHWTRNSIESENSILYGIRLQAPGSEASLKCYGRSRKIGDNYADSLKETMKRGGYTNIKKESKKINQYDVIQISGDVAAQHMVVSIFEPRADKYFIVILMASKQELVKLRPAYSAIVDSYGDASRPPTSVVSIEKLEQQLEKNIEKKTDYLVGSTVYLKMKNGVVHKGVVIAEDDNTITLESFRFGGRYSFKVARKDISEIIR
ncbi:MAG: hypothetical protein P8075_09920 [Deltaproteobacteria bacterium]|jgi:hypothetical protein